LKKLPFSRFQWSVHHPPFFVEEYAIYRKEKSYDFEERRKVQIGAKELAMISN
jgi:hypothetical protein